MPLLATAMQAKTDYLTSYGKYWTQTVAHAARPSIGPWDNYRTHFDAAASKDALPKLQELQNQVKAALARLGVAVPPEVIRADATLADKTFPASADALLATWTGLAGKSAADLRHDILFTYDDVQRRHLLFSAISSDLVSDYYAWVPLHAFDLLYAENRAAGIDQAAVTLATFGKQYPFNKSSDKEDTVAQAADVHQALQFISPAAIMSDSPDVAEVWDRFTGQKPVADAGLSAQALLIIRDRDTLLRWQKDVAAWTPGVQLLIDVDPNTNSDTGWYLRIRQDKTDKLVGKLGAKLQTAMPPGAALDVFIYPNRDLCEADDQIKRIAIDAFKGTWGLLRKFDDAKVNEGKVDIAVPTTDRKLRLAITVKP